MNRLEPLGRPRAALLVALVGALSFGVGIFDHEIWAPTEPSVAGIVWTMRQGGSLAVPRILDFEFLEKPPLSYWLPLLSCGVAGDLSAGCLRFPSAVLAVLSLGLLYWIVRLRNGSAVAGLAVLFNLTSMEFYQFAHRAGNDIAALFFIYFCFALFLKSLLMPADRVAKVDLAFAAVLAVSFYAKNFFTYLFVLPPIFLFLALRRQHRRAARLAMAVAALTVLAVAPWLAAIYQEGGWEYVRVVVFDNTFGRFFNFADQERFEPGPLNDAFRAERDAPRYLYLYMFFWPPAPWTLVLVSAMCWLFRRSSADEVELFLKVALLAVPAMLSLSASGTGTYIAPLLFIMLVLVGDFLGELYSRPANLRRFERELAIANFVVVPVLFVTAPLGLAVYFRTLPVAGIAAGASLAFMWVMRGHRGDWSGFQFGWRISCAAAVSAFFTAWLAMPALDGTKSYAVFFREIGEHIEGREVYTNTLNITRLPLILYYLDRRVNVIADISEIAGLLKREEKISVILDRQGYRDVKGQLGEGMHDVVTPSMGNRNFVLVNNL